ncbi:MAG: helix-turn-helix transcriptional regulator [Treponemataceae bacterium]|nr:helix-turn-helix transcriptional regulator [Treponemataceae bacterium]
MVFLTALAIAGAMQGILILILIIGKYRHPKNLFLALLILVFSIRLGTIPLWDASIMATHRWLWPTVTTLPFLFGPLLLLTIQSLSSYEIRKIPFVWCHFIPYGLSTTTILFFISAESPPAYETFIAKVFYSTPPSWALFINASKVLLNMGYVLVSLKIAFGKQSRQLSSIHRCWIRTLTLIAAIVLIFFSYVALYPQATVGLGSGKTTPFLFLAITMVVLVYSIAFLLIFSPTSLQEGGIPLYYKGLSPSLEEECTKLAEQVVEKFRQGIFKNPTLSESTLAKQLLIHPNRLSLAINHTFHIPFRTLLNRQRLAYFQEEVRKGALQHKSILQLAYEAGFPSKSTFNRVFKEELGMTPSEFEKKETTFSPQKTNRMAIKRIIKEK